MNSWVKRKIDCHEVISFDVFDTLIKRNVLKPQQIYKATELFFEQRNGYSISGFSEQRFKNELHLWKKNNGIIDIYSIYDTLPEFSRKEKEELLQIEIELEKKNCVCNPYMQDIINYCIRNKKKLIAISDIYLPTNIITDIVEGCYGGIFERIYTSCDIKRTKVHGDIYPVIVNDLKINAQDIFHIGDDLVADFFKARENGLCAYKISRVKNYNFYFDVRRKYDDILFSVVAANLNNMIFENENIRRGYEILGFLLYDFSHWLERKTKELDLSEIFFLSREGLLLKHEYEKVIGSSEKVKYLYVSRRSTTIPLLCECSNKNEIFDIIKFRKQETIESIYNKLGLTISDVDVEFPADMIITREQLKKDFFDILITNNWNIIVENSKREKSILLKYLQQEIRGKKIAIVDIGWSGTMQDNLQKILPNKEIYGFYLNVDNFKKDDKKKYSYLNNQIHIKNLFAYRGVVESLFMADHGTTLCYAEKNDKIEPILQNEYKQKDNSFINEHQKGALMFIDNHSNLIDIVCLRHKCPQDVAALGLDMLLNHPTKKDVDNWGKQKFYDGKYRELIPKFSINIKSMLNSFIESDWKIGYLKKIFKFNGIVDGLIKILRKIK